MGSTNGKIQEPFQPLPQAVVHVPKVNILMVHIWAFRLRHSIKKMTIVNITCSNDERIPKLSLPPPSAVGQVPGVRMLMVHIWAFRLRNSIKSMAIGNITRPNDKSSLFDLLPDELLLKVLNYLSLPDLALQIRPLGNKRLRHICEDVSICKSITIDEMWDKRTARAVLFMARQRIENLTVAVKKKKGYYFNLKNAVETKVNWNRQDHLRDRVESDVVLSTVLAVIDEFGNKIGHKITLRMLSIKTKLHAKYLSMSCPFSNTLIANVPYALKHLTKIDMQDATFMKGSGKNDWIKVVADHCMYLEHVRFPFLNNLTNQEFNYFLSRVQKTLKHLSLHCRRLTDYCYRNLKHCQHLETLIIERAQHIRQKGLRNILKLPNLQQLYISFAKELTGADFAQVLHDKVMPKMMCLEMENMAASTEDITLQMISKTYPNLHLLLLYMHGKQGPSDVGIKSMLDTCRKLAFFTIHQYVGKAPLKIKGFNSHFRRRTNYNYCTYQSTINIGAKKITSLRWPELIWKVRESSP